jgi:cytochrome b pre-mRNA-processing protein 3
MTGQQATSGASPAAVATSPWWRRLIEGRRARTRRRDTVVVLYRELVGQAREPFLYADLGVPDTREGRLEMVLLHAILVMRRLRAEGAAGKELAQALFDLFFADVDRHLREWGIGDLSVGRHVKKVAQSFYARAGAVEPLLGDGGDVPALAGILARNVYGDEAAGGAATAGVGGDEAVATRLARYLQAQAAHLDLQPGNGLLAGRPGFAPAGRPGPGDAALPPPSRED